jgi:peptide-methionine (S)-S-oxide reductase
MTVPGSARTGARRIRPLRCATGVAQDGRRRELPSILRTYNLAEVFVGRSARVLIATLLVTGAVAGAARVRRSIVGSIPTVTSRTDYGRRNPVVKTETATFAAGCFWKLEHAMRRVPGVVATVAGYTGGESAGGEATGREATGGAPAPTHAAVSAGGTGLAEAVRVEYDPAVVSYDALLAVFWTSHDPMQFVREPGEPPSPGRSAIFYHTDAQRAAAVASKASLRASLRSSGKDSAAEIPTEILPAPAFFPAEAEHQQYLDRTGGGGGACRLR